MKTDLRSLKHNPTRDMKVDPIDPDRVKELRTSIKDSGFWGGVVVGRLKNGGGEVILAGHNRIQAALMEGITEADVFIMREPTPETMLRIYGMENATQRGNVSASVTGTVAGAIRLIARDLGSGNFDRTRCRTDIGRPEILKLLGFVPGIGDAVIRQQIAALKQSGNYDRIIAEVAREIERDAKTTEEKQRATEQAEKAEARAEEKPIFDLVGVQQHFKTPSHVDAFRRLVTGPLLKDTLPVTKQAALAQSIVTLAKKQKRELTAHFIEDEAIALLGEAKREMTKAEKHRLEQAGIREKIQKQQQFFDSHVRSAMTSALKLIELAHQYEGEIRPTNAFLKALETIQVIASKLGPQARRLTHAKTKS